MHVCVCVCVSVCLHSCVTCVESYSQCTQQCPPQGCPQCSPGLVFTWSACYFKSTTHTERTLCYLLWPAFPLSTTPLWTIRVVVCISTWFFFIAIGFSTAGMYHCLTIGCWMTLGMLPIFALKNKIVIDIVKWRVFPMNMGFHFSWIKSWESNCWIIW